MVLEDRIAEAEEIIHQRLELSHHPIIMSSFGKDSIVLIDLIRNAGKTGKRDGIQVPVLWFRQDMPEQSHRFKFAYEVIKLWGLRVHDYWPEGVVPLPVLVTSGDNTLADMPEKRFQLAFRYSNGLTPEGRPGYFIVNALTTNKLGTCYFDLAANMKQPRGPYPYAWDCTFIGHKEADTDLAWKGVHVPGEGTRCGATRFSYPLRQWTDSDIWEYTHKFNLPINHDRYDFNNWDTADTDTYDVCCNCISTALSTTELSSTPRHCREAAYCPKTDGLVETVALPDSLRLP